MSKPIEGLLGIDNGTQGLTVIFTDLDLNVIATCESTYDFVQCLDEGCYEQRCEDWEQALVQAMARLREKLAPSTISILSIGISGQMHGEVLVDSTGTPIQPVRLWCDARNDEESLELSTAFGCKVPKRVTAARFLWTVRNKTKHAMKTAHITTPGGWLAYLLTGEFNLGIGDASGMFPIDATTLSYDEGKLAIFDNIVNNSYISPLAVLLPRVHQAGESAGSLTENGADLLGIEWTGGLDIPVAAAEGDQVAALAGSLIGRAGTVSCCFGTSVCANAVGDRAFVGISHAVDHFCAADGKPINMVWLRNGTTFLNTMVKSYGGVLHESQVDVDVFSVFMPQLIAAATDCGGLLALPFMNDEPGLQVSRGGSALIVGWNPENATVGNVARASLVSTMFNLRLGCATLDQQGYPRSELVLTGGLSKTPECGQILADVMNSPVALYASADEGSSWGAAVLAKYRYLHATSDSYSTKWSEFLDLLAAAREVRRFVPNPSAVKILDGMFARHQRLVELHPAITKAVNFSDEC